MRLFLFNAHATFDQAQVRQKTRVATASVRKILRMLEGIGFLTRNSITRTKTTTRGKGKQKKTYKTKRKVTGWKLNKSFPYISPLHNLLINRDPFTQKEITQKLSKGGKLKLVVISGVFIQKWDSRVDILVVGDNLKKNVITTIIRGMEAEVGKELTYAVFDTVEFMYRVNVFDKLIRDIFDFPHDVVLDKLDITKRLSS